MKPLILPPKSKAGPLELSTIATHDVVVRDNGDGTGTVIKDRHGRQGVTVRLADVRQGRWPR